MQITYIPIGPKVVPFWASYLEFYKVLPKRNYFGAYGYVYLAGLTAFEGFYECARTCIYIDSLAQSSVEGSDFTYAEKLLLRRLLVRTVFPAT